MKPPKTEGLFDYPLPIPRHTLYEELGLGPEATPEEIREAKAEAVRKLRARRAAIQTRMASLTAGSHPARRQHAEQEPLERELRQLRAEHKKLEEREVQINTIGLESTEKRRQYDAEHPPLALLKLAPPAGDVFKDNRLVIVLLRRELSAFLQQRGMDVFHPSDLTRIDFTSDFTYFEILDGE